jgi:hypothetical protein
VKMLSRLSFGAIVGGMLAFCVLGQQIGTNNKFPDYHLPFNLKTCTGPGRCTTESKSAVLDANWRWLSSRTGQYKNCYTGTTWDPTFCSDPVKCAQTCGLEPIDQAGWGSSYGVHSVQNGAGVTLDLLRYPNAIREERWRSHVLAR